MSKRPCIVRRGAGISSNLIACALGSVGRMAPSNTPSPRSTWRRRAAETMATGREGRWSADRDAGRHPATHRMVEKPATPTGRKRYAQRKRLSEAPNGRIREVLGFRRSGVGGPAKARGGMEPGMAGVEHQAAAGAPGSVRTPAFGISSYNPYRRTRRLLRTLPRTPPVIAHFRCLDPRLRPRIASGPFIRSRSRANFLRRRLLDGNGLFLDSKGFFLELQRRILKFHGMGLSRRQRTGNIRNWISHHSVSNMLTTPTRHRPNEPSTPSPAVPFKRTPLPALLRDRSTNGIPAALPNPFGRPDTAPASRSRTPSPTLRHILPVSAACTERGACGYPTTLPCSDAVTEDDRHAGCGNTTPMSVTAFADLVCSCIVLYTRFVKALRRRESERRRNRKKCPDGVASGNSECRRVAPPPTRSPRTPHPLPRDGPDFAGRAGPETIAARPSRGRTLPTVATPGRTGSNGHHRV